MTESTRLPLIARLSQQPITLAELNHQARSEPRRKRRWMRWIDRGFTVLIYGTALTLLVNEIIGLILLTSGRRVVGYLDVTPDWVQVLTVITVIAAVILHFRRMFQTLALSANSIARERQANNRDMLVLTGIDAGKIVRGKWWATVRHMRWPYIRLGILRATLITWSGAASNSSYYSYAAYGGNNDATNTGIFFPMLLQFILAGAIVFILTMANLLFTAACGMSAFNKRSGVALARAGLTRILLIIGFALLGFLIARFWISYAYTSSLIPSIGALSLATMFDNGITVGNQLATYNFYGYYGYGSNINPAFAVFLPAAIVALLIYALLTFLLLRLAQWQAVRISALPPVRRQWVKIV